MSSSKKNNQQTLFGPPSQTAMIWSDKIFDITGQLFKHVLQTEQYIYIHIKLTQAVHDLLQQLLLQVQTHTHKHSHCQKRGLKKSMQTSAKVQDFCTCKKNEYTPHSTTSTPIMNWSQLVSSCMSWDWWSIVSCTLAYQRHLTWMRLSTSSTTLNKFAEWGQDGDHMARHTTATQQLPQTLTLRMVRQVLQF